MPRLFLSRSCGWKCLDRQHKFGDGECGQLKWVEFPPAGPLPAFQLHFVQQFHKFEGNLSVARIEHFFERLRGLPAGESGELGELGELGGDGSARLRVHDAYMDNRVGFLVDTLRPCALPSILAPLDPAPASALSGSATPHSVVVVVWCRPDGTLPCVATGAGGDNGTGKI
jgi:hypothetical protein